MRNPKVERKCIVCGRKFITRGYRTHTCRKDCAKIYGRITAYYRLKHWTKKGKPKKSKK